ncbi:unnamed protein product [Prorocentrum cordatum]|uniref:Transmembrane protein n=1 Tax=Prorocentrum cordatum TaxID=2364126 RepID=A0ABN9Q2T0_9DINO|nr:unnamed protein product [Polarella glacialis]
MADGRAESTFPRFLLFLLLAGAAYRVRMVVVRSRSWFKRQRSLATRLHTALTSSAAMRAALTLLALAPAASALSLHRAEVDAEDTLFALSSAGASQQVGAEERAGDTLFALSSESEAQQAGQQAEDEYNSVSSLLSEAEALLQEEVASDREAAEEEMRSASRGTRPGEPSIQWFGVWKRVGYIG